MHQRVLVVSGGEAGAVVCPHLASLVTQYGSLAPKWGHELPDMRELGRWSGMLDTLLAAATTEVNIAYSTRNQIIITIMQQKTVIGKITMINRL